MFHLIRRGRENLLLLTKQTFAVQADATGKKYVYQALDEMDKITGESINQMVLQVKAVCMKDRIVRSVQ